jgi:hypothetical protein
VAKREASRSSTSLGQPGKPSVIQQMYNVGNQLQELCSRGKSMDDALLSLGFPIQNKFNSYKKRELANLVKPPELQRYVKAEGEDSFTWSHVIKLLTLKEISERRKWFKAAVAGHWSASRLGKAIKRANGRGVLRELDAQSASKQGRKFGVPATLEELTEQLNLHLERAFNYAEFLRKLPPAAKTLLKLSSKQEAWLYELSGAIQKLAKMP